MNIQRDVLTKNIDDKIRLAIVKLPSVKLCKKRKTRQIKRFEKLQKIAKLYGY